MNCVDAHFRGHDRLFVIPAKAGIQLPLYTAMHGCILRRA